MKMKKSIIFGLLLLAVIHAPAADGNETVDLLKSPEILASGGNYTSEFSPMADIINPAASALQQRLSLNANAAALFGDQTTPGYNGFVLSLGSAMPTRAGVFTASGYILAHNPVAELNAGFQGGLKAGFSKELYPGMLAGAGLNMGFGESISFTADIGVIDKIGDIGIMKNFRWGAVLSEFGYTGFSANDYPSPFTLGAGVGFDLIDTDNVVLAVNSDLTLPTFSNIRLNIGTDIHLFNLGGLKVSSAADLKELIAGDVSALIPAFGIYMDLAFGNSQTDTGTAKAGETDWEKSDFRATAAASPMANGLWAVSAGANFIFGVYDEVPPVIELDISAIEDNTEDDEETVEESDEDTDEEAAEGTVGKQISGKFLKTGKRLIADENEKDVPDKEKTIVRNNPGNITEGPRGEKIITYISPNNDGIKDFIDIPVKISDSRYIKGFAFIVEDAEGNEVKRIENKEKRPENLGLSNFFERLFYVEKGVNIPESIRWDGFDNNGSVVSDGFYRFFMEAWDDNDNRSQTEKYGIVVDNTPPELTLNVPESEDKIFSPNDDGNKDVLPIEQSGSSEDMWKGVIKTAGGRVVKNFLWKNSPPESFRWDGKNNQKQLAPDGVYFYYIEATDRAGNKTEAELANIIINTESTPISLSVDASYFAPGIPGSREEVTFLPDIPIKTGIVDWTFEISDENGKAVKTLRGSSEIPESFVYRGELNGKYIPEGNYKGFIEVEYLNGNNPSAESPSVTADKTAPSASVKASLKIFSPNGDGNKDEVVIYQETSKEDVWYGEIADESGISVRKYKWVNNAASSFEWEGYTDKGLLAPDGEYSYRLYTEDRAGNKGSSETISLTLDTEETPVILTTNLNAFSPNGNGVKDELTLNPVLNVTEGIKSYTVRIFNTNDKVVKTIGGQGRIRESFTWDGFSDEGNKAPDGEYYAELEVEYLKGDVSIASTRKILLDTVYPKINIEAEYKLFSPDDDGRKDSLTIKQDSSREDLFVGKILNEAGETVRQFSWKGKAENVVWDGRDENGNISNDGNYSYIISSEDDAGNRTEATIYDIEIDNRRTTVFVTAESSGFAPNDNGKNDEIGFSTIATLKDGVSNWEFNILRDGVRPVKSFSGTTLPEKIIWDGRSDSGKLIEGSYKAEYIVTYKKGNRPVAVTNSFILDVSPPEIEMNVSPKPFSPDNDGYDDELTISISVEDESKIESWSLDIRDRGKNSVKRYGGSGKPTEKIIWDGVGDDGELVIAAEDYAYRLRVNDEFGNVSEELGIIPVDVLVVQEGDKLKIRIANITFAPDSAELRRDDPEIREKNEYVLGRLSEILKKYESYNIQIEGHAVSVFWATPEKARVEEIEELQPLSKARAETVKNYLQQLGISGSRMKTEGIGGKKPIVPHGDLDNRWKNRRVEFILLK